MLNPLEINTMISLSPKSLSIKDDPKIFGLPNYNKSSLKGSVISCHYDTKLTPDLLQIANMKVITLTRVLGNYPDLEDPNRMQRARFRAQRLIHQNSAVPPQLSLNNEGEFEMDMRRHQEPMLGENGSVTLYYEDSKLGERNYLIIAVSNLEKVREQFVKYWETQLKKGKTILLRDIMDDPVTIELKQKNQWNAQALTARFAEALGLRIQLEDDPFSFYSNQSGFRVSQIAKPDHVQVTNCMVIENANNIPMVVGSTNKTIVENQQRSIGGRAKFYSSTNNKDNNNNNNNNNNNDKRILILNDAFSIKNCSHPSKSTNRVSGIFTDSPIPCPQEVVREPESFSTTVPLLITLTPGNGVLMLNIASDNIEIPIVAPSNLGTLTEETIVVTNPTNIPPLNNESVIVLPPNEPYSTFIEDGDIDDDIVITAPPPDDEEEIYEQEIIIKPGTVVPIVPNINTTPTTQMMELQRKIDMEERKRRKQNEIVKEELTELREMKERIVNNIQITEQELELKKNEEEKEREDLENRIEKIEDEDKDKIWRRGMRRHNFKNYTIERFDHEEQVDPSKIVNLGTFGQNREKSNNNNNDDDERSDNNEDENNDSDYSGESSSANSEDDAEDDSDNGSNNESSSNSNSEPNEGFDDDDTNNDSPIKKNDQDRESNEEEPTLNENMNEEENSSDESDEDDNPTGNKENEKNSEANENNSNDNDNDDSDNDNNNNGSRHTREVIGTKFLMSKDRIIGNIGSEFTKKKYKDPRILSKWLKEHPILGNKQISSQQILLRPVLGRVGSKKMGLFT